MSVSFEIETAASLVQPHHAHEICYPESHDDDMGESSLHTKLIDDFVHMLRLHLAAVENVFITSNLNIYYVKGNPYKWFAPDILVAFGVGGRDRQVYKLWEEAAFPQIAFEVASERTWKNDVGDKLDLYNELGAEEYYLLDPERDFLPVPLIAYQRQNDVLAKVPIVDGRVYSPRLGLEIVDDGDNLRLFNPKTNEFLQSPLEQARRITILEAELEQMRRELERLKGQN